MWLHTSCQAGGFTATAFFLCFLYSPSQLLHYQDVPLKIVRGQGQYLFDEVGNKYLDTCNNVSHGMYYTVCKHVCLVPIICIPSNPQKYPV